MSNALALVLRFCSLPVSERVYMDTGSDFFIACTMIRGQNKNCVLSLSYYALISLSIKVQPSAMCIPVVRASDSQ